MEHKIKVGTMVMVGRASYEVIRLVGNEIVGANYRGEEAVFRAKDISGVGRSFSQEEVPMGMLEDASYEEQCEAQGYYPDTGY